MAQITSSTTKQMPMIVALLALAFGLAHVSCQGTGSGVSNIPGAQTASGILASSADGMSRYLAPDGPIQPALTAIGGLPMRGTEMVNNGITSISSGLNSGAQSLSRAAGQNGQIRMPGMDALESVMPASVSQMGEMMHGAIKQKNNFIRGQAERGIQAGQRLGQMMQDGLQVRSSGGSKGGMPDAMSMMSGAHEAMSKGAQELKKQVQQSLGGTMGRMQQMQGMGQNVQRQVQAVGRTLTSGLQGAASQLQRTGEQAMSQLQSGMKQNSQQMQGVLGSLTGSMGNMGQNAQKNLQGLVRHAQNAASQVTNHIQQTVQGPLSMLQNLGSSMMKGGSGMMKGGSGSGGY